MKSASAPRRRGSAAGIAFCRFALAKLAVIRLLSISEQSCRFSIVTPAQAGVQGLPARRPPWVPAFAGTTAKQSARRMLTFFIGSLDRRNIVEPPVDLRVG